MKFTLTRDALACALLALCSASVSAQNAAPLPSSLVPSPDASLSKPPVALAGAKSGVALELSRVFAATLGARAVAMPLEDFIRYTEDAERQLRAAGAKLDIDQQVFLVDAGAKAQVGAVAWRSAQGAWELIGAGRVSTGAPNRFDYYLTPSGVFENTMSNHGFRAQGTPNENGIKGYGVKGKRVWDFGWQTGTKGWGAPEPRQIRFLAHATDPTYLEPRLGKQASQGCVRLSGALNEFMDAYGTLDANYEADPKVASSWLLRKDRKPMDAGRYMVVTRSAWDSYPDWLALPASIPAPSKKASVALPVAATPSALASERVVARQAQGETPLFSR